MTVYIAVANDDNDLFSVKRDQVIASVDLNDELFINPENGEFDQDLFDSYFYLSVLSDPDGAIAEMIGCTWSENNDNAVAIYPIISKRVDE
jgi:hypothetical protein